MTRVLFIASEVFPLIKTGGLADVAAALPAALHKRGVDIRLLLPGYPSALENAGSLKEVMQFNDPLGCGQTRLLETNLPGSGVKTWLIDCPQIFSRNGGAYQDPDGQDWHDNHLRFGLLSYIATLLATERGQKWSPDIVHANDWHAGLAPALVSVAKNPRPATIFTIHNLAYQGIFAPEVADHLDLPADIASSMEFYGRLSFLKAGIKWADAVTTVSPNYAQEILSSENGCGLDGLLRERAPVLHGIMNGVDYGIWNPETDTYLTHNYGPGQLSFKSACKTALQNEVGLDHDEAAPLVGFMSRIVHQKMPDIVLEALPSLIETGKQFVLVGDGERQYEDGFRAMQERYPGRVAVRIGYREDMAHRLLAGVDVLLHPARFEPCGLVPLYAMRYGTVPVGCRNGGMVDSIIEGSPAALRNGTATGFFLETETAQGLRDCMDRVFDLYRKPLLWRKLQVHIMQRDHSWAAAAKAYDGLYRSLANPSNDLEAPLLSKLSA